MSRYKRTAIATTTPEQNVEQTPTNDALQDALSAWVAESGTKGTPEQSGTGCACGCGGSPKGAKSRYLPGHDARHHAAIAGTTRGPRPCACGCGATTKGGTWMPGHDAKHASRMAKRAKELAAVDAAFGLAA